MHLSKWILMAVSIFNQSCIPKIRLHWTKQKSNKEANELQSALQFSSIGQRHRKWKDGKKMASTKTDVSKNLPKKPYLYNWNFATNISKNYSWIQNWNHIYYSTCNSCWYKSLRMTKLKIEWKRWHKKIETNPLTMTKP